MAKHAKRGFRIKTSTMIIAVMYLTWVGYIFFQASFYAQNFTFLPAEVTLGTAAVFIGETVSLARLKMAQEGAKVTPKNNQFLTQLGLNQGEFEQDAINTSEQKEASHG